MNQDRKKFFGSLAIPALLVTLMWVVKVAEMAFSIDLNSWGLIPQTTRGLIGVLTLPFLHGNWEHLLTNTRRYWFLALLCTTATPPSPTP